MNTWKLSEIHCEKAFKELQKKLKEFKGYVGKEHFQTIEAVSAFIDTKEKVLQQFSQVYLDIFLRHILDTQNRQWNTYLSEYHLLSIQLYESFVEADEKLKTCGVEKIQQYITLEDSHNMNTLLKEFVEKMKYMVDQDTEKLLNSLDGSSYHLINVYDELVGSLVFAVVVDGEKKECTEAEVRSMLESVDRTKRKEAWFALEATYKKHKIALSGIYQFLTGYLNTILKKRGYTSAFASRSISEQIPHEIIVNMLNVVKEHYRYYQQYLSCKQKILGYDIHAYDIYAGVGNQVTFSFEKARLLVTGAAKEISQEYADIIDVMFKEGRVDVFPKKGKSSGAFCISGEEGTSWIMLNYTQTFDDVLTLMHETGHAYHNYCSRKQRYMYQEYSIPLAETASLFGELVLFDYLLEQGDVAKQIILEKLVSTLCGSIFTQVMYTSFEERIHTIKYNDEALHHEQIQEIWFEERKKLFGDCIPVSDYEQMYHWNRIPHIYHAPFYCYSYAFGNLLALYIHSVFRTNKEAGRSMFHTIISAGGSKSVEEILAQAGIDIYSSEFFKRSLQELERYMSLLKEEVNKTC